MTKEIDYTGTEINVNGGKVKMGYKTAFSILALVSVAFSGWILAGYRISNLEDETVIQGVKIEILGRTVVKIETQYDTIIRTLQRIEDKQ